MEQFESYFQRADLDRDGKISGHEAVAFFQGSNLPKPILAQIWMHSDQKNTGFLGRAEFFNALRLVTVAQSGRELSKEIVKAALEGPAAAKIPPPRINSVPTSAPPVNPILTARPPINSSLPSPTPMVSNLTIPSQSVGLHGAQIFPNSGMNHKVSSDVTRSFHATPASSLPMQSVSEGLLVGDIVTGPRPPTSNLPNLSTDWFGGKTGDASSASVPSRNVATVANLGFGAASTSSVTAVSAKATPQGTSSLMASLPPKAAGTLSSSLQPADKDSKISVNSGNGFAFDPVFGGDGFSVNHTKQDISSSILSASRNSSTSTTTPITSGYQSSKIVQVNSLASTSTAPAGASQFPLSQSFVKKNQQGTITNTSGSASSVQAGIPGSVVVQSHWPKMTQSAIQKYTKVFVEVDKDRDGKISGEQARNLFMSWKLPREILKQVWDLSDQDSDNMLSLREFCIALYLMERFREGRPLPTVLPNSLLYADALLQVTSQPSARQGGLVWQPTGFSHQGKPQSQSVMPAAGSYPQQHVRKPLHFDDQVQPVQKKATVPVLEKHFVNQLSNEEQSALISKLKEATEADKKVQELEKEIMDSKEKIEFYHTKMQELVLYKSRCDNRLNETMDRASGDKHEVDVLAKKYEEKYKNVGDVASKLTIEEATFRDIQERKLELFNAIVKINEGGNADGLLQDRVNQIQSDLDELVIDLNANCKQYGLRAKPTSLVELPFGWQPGIQEGAADWDENWDKFDDEEFMLVKDLTIDVENIIAPPKSKSPSMSSQKVSQEEISPDANNTSKTFTESEMPHAHSENGSMKSPPSSPPVRDPWGSPPSQEFSLPKFVTYDDYDGKDNESDHGGAESIISSEKNADDHQWGDTFDKHDDADPIWGFDKESGDNKSNQNFLFGSETFGLNPIRTGSGSPSASGAYGNENSAFFDSVPPSATSVYGKDRSPFFDSVPPSATSVYGKDRSPFFDSVPPSATSVYGKDRSPFFDSVPPSATSVYGKDRSPFFDSVPGTPSFDSGFSPRYTEGLDQSFGFNNFDSFSSSQGNFGRFDSLRSSKDSEHGGFIQQENLSRFDSFRSSTDFDHGQGFPSFDNTDAFGSGPFKSSENPTVRSSDNWSSF